MPNLPGMPHHPPVITRKRNRRMSSRGLRNNNPGNIRLSRTLWQGEVHPSQDRSFCQFKSMAYGYRALIKLLQNYRRLNGCRTVADFINRWAPPVRTILRDISAVYAGRCMYLQVMFLM